MPEVIPATTPVGFTVAVVALLLVHTPAGTASLKAVVNPVHTLAVPVIAVGCGVTFTVVIT